MPLPFAATCALAFTLVSAPAAQALTFVDSLADFTTLIGAGTTTQETFETPIAGATAVTFANGITSTLLNPDNLFGDFLLPQTDNAVASGVFSGYVAQTDPFGDFATTLRWDFAAPVIGIAMTFGPNPSIPGFSNSGVVVVTEAGTPGEAAWQLEFLLPGAPDGSSVEGFFGLVDPDTPFQNIEFHNWFDPEGAFAVDDVILASAPAAIPGPAAFPLLLAACGAVAGLRRRPSLRGRH